MLKAFLVGILFILGLYVVTLRAQLAVLRQPVIEIPDNTWTLVLGGDVMLGRSVTKTALDDQKEPRYPFIGIGDVLRSGDISLVNLENPITDPCPRRNDGMVFCAPPQMLEGLTYSGIDVVNLANNHTLNYGTAGYSATKEFLDLVSISYSDNSTLAIKQVQGIQVGFIGFDRSQLGNPTLTPTEESFVKSSNEQVDVLVVSMHWGVEYQDHPLQGQRTLAQKLVDLGADVVVGHHPHWTQDIAKIGETPVYYSLGNLIFDQMWSEKTRRGLLIKLTFDGTKLINENVFHTYMQQRAQPIIMPSPNE